MEVEIFEMIYKISKSVNNLRILGETFVKNNKNKGYIIINNKKEKIKSFITINNLKNLKQNKIKIKMILIKNIYNISCLFKDCELLESLKYKNISNIKNNTNTKEKNQVIDFIDIDDINL